MPKIGNVVFSSLIRLRQIPASSGVQGPGEITMALGLICLISSIVILSFLYISTSAPSSFK